MPPPRRPSCKSEEEVTVVFHRKDIVFTKASIFQDGIERYADDHSTPASAETINILQATQRDCPEWANIASTSTQVSFLAMLVSLIGARRILEIGTFTGHATVGMAERLPADGQLVTLDSFVADDRARNIAKSAFAESSFEDKINLVEGDAMDSLQELDGQFDLIFVDADKPNYANYFNTVLDRELLAPHGLLVFDNTLWGGAVLSPAEADTGFEEAADGDAWLTGMQRDWARSLVAFNAQVAAEPRVEAVLLTVRDGMTLVRRAA